MPEYQVQFARSARKELQQLSSPIAARVLQRIEALAGAPRPAGSVKLEGLVNLWRIRIGDYRVVYSIDDAKHMIDVNVVRHRSAAYK